MENNDKREALKLAAAEFAAMFYWLLEREELNDVRGWLEQLATGRGLEASQRVANLLILVSALKEESLAGLCRRALLFGVVRLAAMAVELTDLSDSGWKVAFATINFCQIPGNGQLSGRLCIGGARWWSESSRTTPAMETLSQFDAIVWAAAKEPTCVACNRRRPVFNGLCPECGLQEHLSSGQLWHPSRGVWVTDRVRALADRAVLWPFPKKD